MLEIKDLSYSYGNSNGVLDNINIQFPKEHILAILGESGSGKTTLLKCIGKFLKPQTGQILFNGEDITNMDDLSFRRMIGIVFQQLYLFPHLTVLENMILSPVHVLKKDKETALKEALHTLKKLGIDDISKSYPSQISGGQAQRVAIARALVLKPQYLLLDEPTAALDIVTTNDFGRWLVTLKEETTFIVVTHDIPFAENVASSGVLLEQGIIKAEGTIKAILSTVHQAVEKDDEA